AASQRRWPVPYGSISRGSRTPSPPGIAEFGRIVLARGGIRVLKSRRHGRNRSDRRRIVHLPHPPRSERRPRVVPRGLAREALGPLGVVGGAGLRRALGTGLGPAGARPARCRDAARVRAAAADDGARGRRRNRSLLRARTARTAAIQGFPAAAR